MITLQPCPPAGTGCHGWLLGAANTCDRRGIQPADAEQIILRHMTRQPNSRTEIAEAIEKAFRECGKLPSGGFRSQAGNFTRPTDPKWPTVNVEQRQAIVGDGIGLADLWEASPLRLDPEHRATEWVVDQLFPGNPLLCCGVSKSSFATATRETYRGRMHRLQLIVPSAMSAVEGLVADGSRMSHHTKANTGPRQYLIVEFDTGTTDEQAALLLHLAGLAPLRMVVFSGSKSLHGWFDAIGRDEDTLRRFFNVAVSLGADPATWQKHQFVRMPDGTRENGARQSVYFFNPMQTEVK